MGLLKAKLAKLKSELVAPKVCLCLCLCLCRVPRRLILLLYLFSLRQSGSGKAGEGFDVTKVCVSASLLPSVVFPTSHCAFLCSRRACTQSGDTRIGLVGFPSVGKSTLLTKLTGTFSEAAAYEFTTLTAVPGTLHYRGAKIQLLDLPGIIEGAKDGKGRGRQVIGTARTCNVICIVLDATR